jgi:DNA-binding transcriptional regulator YiaG
MRHPWNREYNSASRLGCVLCPKCKSEDPIILNMNGLMRALARAVIEKPYRLTGEEVRFLRKYLRLTVRQGEGP